MQKNGPSFDPIKNEMDCLLCQQPRLLKPEARRMKEKSTGAICFPLCACVLLGSQDCFQETRMTCPLVLSNAGAVTEMTHYGQGLEMLQN